MAVVVCRSICFYALWVVRQSGHMSWTGDQIRVVGTGGEGGNKDY